MISVGLTGNIGSGKSTVAAIFQTLGIPVYPADEEAKKMYDIPSVRHVIAAHFGSSILQGSSLNRKALASIVFQYPDELKFLQELIHPLVMEDFQHWLKRWEEKPYTILESAILFESTLDGSFVKIILVTCPLSVRLDRIMQRDHASREEVLIRQQAQWDEQRKIPQADFIIDNHGQIPLIPQVMNIHQTLLQID